MGGENIGLSIEIGADTSQAEAAMARFEQSEQAMVPAWEEVGVSANEAGQKIVSAGEAGGKSLLGAHQATHLLAEEMGIHLPRAVVSAVSEMLPSLSQLGGALLGVFAVKELYHWAGEAVDKFHEVMREGEGDIESLDAAATAAFKHMRDEAGKIFTDFKTPEAGEFNIAEIDSRAAQLLKYHEAYVKWEATGNQSMRDFVALGAETMRTLAEAKKEGLNSLAEVDSKVSEIGQLQFSARQHQAAITAKAEEEGTEAAEKVLREHSAEVSKAAREQEQAARRGMDSERLLGRLRSEAANTFRKQAAEDEKADQKKLSGAREIATAEINLIGIENVIFGLGQKNQALARTAVPLIIQQTNETKHLSAAKRDLILVRQQMLRAQEAENDTLAGNTAYVAQNVAAILEVLGAKRAYSAVMAVYETAEGFKALGEKDYWGAAQDFASAAEYAKVAGTRVPSVASHK